MQFMYLQVEASHLQVNDHENSLIRAMRNYDEEQRHKCKRPRMPLIRWNNRFKDDEAAITGMLRRHRKKTIWATPHHPDYRYFTEPVLSKNTQRTGGKDFIQGLQEDVKVNFKNDKNEISTCLSSWIFVPQSYLSRMFGKPINVQGVTCGKIAMRLSDTIRLISKFYTGGVSILL